VDILKIVHGIAAGLVYLHSKGIIHADIKPQVGACVLDVSLRI
jgi:serine/threonine protein kinase